MDERFKRTKLMLGDEAFERLQGSFAIVVGLGAVGSYAVEGLARAGVGRIRVIDFDVVSPSNINRQLYALESTVGRPKCEIAEQRILDINPSCRVEAVRAFVDADTVGRLMEGSPDIVIDAIDSVGPKVDLVAYLRANEIPLISSLGAALRTDPTQVRIGPLSDAKGCPLGSRMRKFLKRRGVPMDFLCVYSEEALPNPLPVIYALDGGADKPIIDRGRRRNTLGSMPTLTGIFGLTAANTATKILAGKK